MTMQRRAMTLWEVLIVLTILSIAAAIFWPVGHRGATRHHRNRSICAANLRQIALACAHYAQDYDRHLPPVSNRAQGWADLLLPEIKSVSTFQCPSEKPSNGPFSSDYFFNSRVAGLSRSQMPFPSQTIGFGDGLDNAAPDSHLSQLPQNWKQDDRAPSSRHLSRANYLFIDGHVRGENFRDISTQPPRRQKNSQATFAAR